MDEVRASIQRNLDEEKGGFAEKQLRSRLADCIDREVLDEAQAAQETIREYVKDIKEVAATLEPGKETCADRREKFVELIDRFERTEESIRLHMATVMIEASFPGLFVGEGEV